MATAEAKALQKERDEELRLKELQEMNRKLDFIIQHLGLEKKAAATEEIEVADDPESEKKPRKSGK